MSCINQDLVPILPHDYAHDQSGWALHDISVADSLILVVTAHHTFHAAVLRWSNKCESIENTSHICVPSREAPAMMLSIEEHNKRQIRRT